MKVGDLVWHNEDIKSLMPVPGILISFVHDLEHLGARVQFMGCTVYETHGVRDLSLTPDLEETSR
jgi:hypothetical protein